MRESYENSYENRGIVSERKREKKIDANAWVFFSESLDGDVKKRKILRFQPERDPLMYALSC